MSSQFQQHSNSDTILKKMVLTTLILLIKGHYDDNKNFFYPFIIGALSNFGKLTLPRLHRTLRNIMHSQNTVYDLSPRELSES